MSDIVRFSVSVESDLLERFDDYCQQEQMATRSEAVRQLIYGKLAEKLWAENDDKVAGTLTLVFDHHRSSLRDQLSEIQHRHTELIVSTLHAHLSHAICLEVIILRGPADQLHKLASELKGLKGVFQGELVMSSEKMIATDLDKNGHSH
jgi:CopG family transcriptional regulator, nickel-responsive regulator